MNFSFSVSSLSRIARGLLMAVLLAGVGVVWTGCDVGAIDDNLGLILNFSPGETTVAGQILDAKTQVPIEADAITVRFSGPDAHRVVDLSGETITELRVPDISLVNFNLRGDVPTDANPAVLNLRISAPNYVTTNERLHVNSAEYLFTANLTNVLDPPSGVEAIVEQFASSGGAPVNDVDVKTDFEDATGARASLRIPKGTVMRDKEGRPLSGTVSATVVYYSNQDDGALGSFPGGLMGVDVDGEDVGSFVTAGFAAVDVVDQQGREAHQFDGTIEVNVDVPPSTVNPQTGQRVQAGDQIPVFSFDADTGTWTAEGQAKARLATSPSAKSRGVLETTIQTNHLTYWNLDWHYPGKCEVGGKQIFEGVSPDWRGTLQWILRGDAQSDAQNREFYRSGYHYKDNFLSFRNAPANWPMTFQLIDVRSGTTVAQGRIADLCRDKTWSVDLPPSSGAVKLSVDAKITCDADQEIRPSDYTVWYYSPQYRDWGTVTMRDGRAAIELIEDAEYRFRIRLKDRWEFRQVRVREDQLNDANDRAEVTVTRVSDSEYRAVIHFRDTEGTVC